MTNNFKHILRTAEIPKDTTISHLVCTRLYTKNTGNLSIAKFLIYYLIYLAHELTHIPPTFKQFEKVEPGSLEHVSVIVFDCRAFSPEDNKLLISSPKNNHTVLNDIYNSYIGKNIHKIYTLERKKSKNVEDEISNKFEFQDIQITESTTMDSFNTETIKNIPSKEKLLFLPLIAKESERNAIGAGRGLNNRKHSVGMSIHQPTDIIKDTSVNDTKREFNTYFNVYFKSALNTSGIDTDISKAIQKCRDVSEKGKGEDSRSDGGDIDSNHGDGDDVLSIDGNNKFNENDNYSDKISDKTSDTIGDILGDKSDEKDVILPLEEDNYEEKIIIDDENETGSKSKVNTDKMVEDESSCNEGGFEDVVGNCFNQEAVVEDQGTGPVKGLLKKIVSTESDSVVGTENTSSNEKKKESINLNKELLVENVENAKVAVLVGDGDNDIEETSEGQSTSTEFDNENSESKMDEHFDKGSNDNASGQTINNNNISTDKNGEDNDNEIPLLENEPDASINEFGNGGGGGGGGGEVTGGGGGGDPLPKNIVGNSKQSNQKNDSVWKRNLAIGIVCGVIIVLLFVVMTVIFFNKKRNVTATAGSSITLDVMNT